MKKFSPHHGFSTLVNHADEGNNPYDAHVMPIYQTSTFSFPDVASAPALFSGERSGYYYTRMDNPNANQLARKYAILEGVDLLRAQPEVDVDEVLGGKIFASGMAAISAAILSRARVGDTIISQRALYGNAFGFLNEIAPRLGLQVIWLEGTSTENWEAAFRDHPGAVIAYTESPVNPTMEIVDLAAVLDIAHQHGAWVIVDNTFATPYCQRPLTIGADVVVHSTTKYLTGHGLVIGGAVVSTQLDYMRQDIKRTMRLHGGAPSPFDAWLANVGLKTFELRMQRHCENAMAVAKYLDAHPKVATVNYPGLPDFPGHEVARTQMHCFGGMLSFELKGGFQAGENLMNSMRMITLAVSLGNVDSLIQHPASMTHRSVPTEARRMMGITDGLVRFSVGIENVEDIIADLEQGLKNV
jgi:methionine-gamma-lyase